MQRQHRNNRDRRVFCTIRITFGFVNAPPHQKKNLVYLCLKQNLNASSTIWNDYTKKAVHTEYKFNTQTVWFYHHRHHPKFAFFSLTTTAKQAVIIMIMMNISKIDSSL